jgi:hypothetical protein
MSFEGKNMKRQREKGGKCKIKRKKEERKRKKGKRKRKKGERKRKKGEKNEKWEVKLNFNGAYGES